MKRTGSARRGADDMLSRGPQGRLEAALRAPLFFSGDALNFLCVAASAKVCYRPVRRRHRQTGKVRKSRFATRRSLLSEKLFGRTAGAAACNFSLPTTYSTPIGVSCTEALK